MWLDHFFLRRQLKRAIIERKKKRILGHDGVLKFWRFNAINEYPCLRGFRVSEGHGGCTPDSHNLLHEWYIFSPVDPYIGESKG